MFGVCSGFEREVSSIILPLSANGAECVYAGLLCRFRRFTSRGFWGAAQACSRSSRLALYVLCRYNHRMATPHTRFTVLTNAGSVLKAFGYRAQALEYAHSYANTNHVAVDVRDVMAHPGFAGLWHVHPEIAEESQVDRPRTGKWVLARDWTGAEIGKSVVLGRCDEGQTWRVRCACGAIIDRGTRQLLWATADSRRATSRRTIAVACENCRAEWLNERTRLRRHRRHKDRTERSARLREELTLTQTAMSKLTGLSNVRISQIECMRGEPPYSTYGWREHAETIATFHGLSPEDIWPESVKEAKREAFRLERAAAEPSPTPEDELSWLEGLERMQEWLKSISKGERELLWARANGERLEDIGQRIGLSKERVRQLEERALLNLRYSLGLLDEEEREWYQRTKRYLRYTRTRRRDALEAGAAS